MKYFYYVIFIFNFMFSQSWYNHTELEWQTIETEHFLIHFHEETKRSGQETAAVAEKIYEPITSFYEFEPDTKTHIIIQDIDDISKVLLITTIIKYSYGHFHWIMISGVHTAG